MNKDEVLKLARLARINISESEAESLTHEFESILGYVSEVKSAQTQSISGSGDAVRPQDLSVYNIFREDTPTHESGKFSEQILSQAPSREGDYIKVKKIL